MCANREYFCAIDMSWTSFYEWRTASHIRPVEIYSFEANISNLNVNYTSDFNCGIGLKEVFKKKKVFALTTVKKVLVGA